MAQLLTCMPPNMLVPADAARLTPVFSAPTPCRFFGYTANLPLGVCALAVFALPLQVPNPSKHKTTLYFPNKYIGQQSICLFLGKLPALKPA